MKTYFAGLGVVMAISMGVAAYASTGNAARPAVPPQMTRVAQASAQCQQEAAQLQARLAQCTTDDCRQQMQAAIAAHNQRCQ